MRTLKWKYEDNPEMLMKMRHARTAYSRTSLDPYSDSCSFCLSHSCDDCPASWVNYEILSPTVPISAGCAYLGRILLRELDKENIE